MHRKLIAIVALAVVGATVAAVAMAGPDSAKQRVAIQTKAGGLFTLTPLTAGAIEPDTGTATFCCWSQRFVTRDGQSIEINNPQATFAGKRGTIVVRKQIEWLDISNGYAISTGTWKVVRGTGDYAGLSGSGRHAGIQFPNGTVKWRDEGFVNSR